MSRGPIRIDPDIRAATTLPAWVYSDPALFALQQERVFAPSWQFVADADRARVPGQVHPFTLLEGMLDEPLLLARDRDDCLHCLSNVCTHRGTLLCEGDAIVTAQLRCRYHGRRFHLDGRFHSMPEFEQAAGFPSPADDLPRVPFGTWEKFVFASLAPAVPLGDWIGAMRERCGWLPVARAVFDPSRSRDYLVRANWALYVDNYLEGFHIPYVHAGLAQAIDYGSYSTERFAWSSLQLAVAAEGGDALEPPAGSPDAGLRVAAWYWWLFPNTMLNVLPGRLQTNRVTALAIDRCRVDFDYFYAPQVAPEARVEDQRFSDEVQVEDIAICEAVQRGLASGSYVAGRLNPTQEAGLLRFHELLRLAYRGPRGTTA